MRKGQGPATWRWLAGRMGPHGGRLVLLCAGTMLSGAGAVALALAVRELVNHGIAGESLAPWAAALVTLAAGLLALQLWLRWYSGRTKDLLIRELRHSLLSALLSKRHEALAQRHSEELVSRLGEDAAIVCGEAATLPPSVTGSVVRLASALAALAWLDQGLALLLLVTGAAVGGGAALLRGPIKRCSLRSREADSLVRLGMQESLENREAVKGLGMEEELLHRAGRLLDGALVARERLRKLSLTASGGLEAVTQIGYCAALVWCVSSVAGGGMSFGTLTAVLQLLLQLRAPVVTLSGIVSRLSVAAASAERLLELEELPDEEPDAALPPEAQPRALVFSHVDFCYPGDDKPVLRDFSLRVEMGDWLCLTGPSGRGKSTVLKLALGFYRPQAGQVYVETDRGRIPCGRTARTLFGYVPQNHALFYGTIRENLLLADPKADDGRLWSALMKADAGFVRNLPQGLDTMLQENSGGLSEGQGQRIALARALLPDAGFLLLDECTSALDQATERQVLRRLRESGRGALLISHHPDALPVGVAVIQMEEQT